MRYPLDNKRIAHQQNVNLCKFCGNMWIPVSFYELRPLSMASSMYSRYSLFFLEAFTLSASL